MKIKADEIKNKDVKSMNNEQLIEFNNQLKTFKTKTKFLRDLQLLKILYCVFGYAFGLGLGICIAKVIIPYIYYGAFNVKYIVLSCILLAVCIALEVLYRVAKHFGKKYSTIVTEKTIEIQSQYNLLNQKKELKNPSETQTQAQTQTENK